MFGNWASFALLALAAGDPPTGAELQAPPLLRPASNGATTLPAVSPANPVVPGATVPDTTLPPSGSNEAPVEPPLDYREATLERLQATLRQLAVANLPETYVDEKDWNKTDRRIDGVDVTFYRGKFETRRKWKEVNHGLWKRYEIELIDSANRMQISVLDLRLDEQGTPRFRMSLRAPLEARGQTAQWAMGVQLFSLGAQATAEIELVVDGSCRIVPAATAFGPTLGLDPHVDAAALTLHSFRLDRVGQAEGDVAEELGEALESLVRQQVEASGDRVAAKLNAAIDKRRDRLVLSLPEFKKSTWGDWLLERVPGLGTVQDDAMESPPSSEAPTASE